MLGLFAGLSTVPVIPVKLLSGLLKLHIDALVMVVYGYGQCALGVLLTDDVAVEIIENLSGLGQAQRIDLGIFDTLLGDDVHAMHSSQMEALGPATSFRT